PSRDGSTKSGQITRVSSRARSCPLIRDTAPFSWRRLSMEIIMNLRQKYDHAIQVAKSVRMQGAAEERDGKLHFNGVVNSEDEKNQIWNAIKTSSSWQQEVVAEIRVQPKAASAPAASAPAAAVTTY